VRSRQTQASTGECRVAESGAVLPGENDEGPATLSSHRANFNRDGRIGLRCASRILARLAGERDGLREGPCRSTRPGDPLNPMDPTAEVGMWNLVKNQGLSGIWMLNLVSAFAGFHTVCILQVRTPVKRRRGDALRCLWALPS